MFRTLDRLCASLAMRSACVVDLRATCAAACGQVVPVEKACLLRRLSG